MTYIIQALKNKSNEVLIKTIRFQVENERKLLMEILYSLQEVEARSLHLEMGFPDLYTFAMKELGYSSGSAYRRISAMRLLKSLPDVAPKLESGKLGLENASQAQSYFRKEDRHRKEQGREKLTLDEKREVVSELFDKSTREGQRILTERAPDIMIPTEKLKPLPEQKTLIQFIASAELMGKLEELKNLFAHQNFEGRIDVLVDQLANIALDKFKPVSVCKPALVSKAAPLSETSPSVSNSRSITPELETTASTPAQGEVSSKENTSQSTLTQKRPVQSKRSRYIPRQVRKQVALRDENGCTYQDPKSGRVCGTRHGLQFDHVVPFSLGGAHSVENLTLKCGAHNRYRAEQLALFRPN